MKINDTEETITPTPAQVRREPNIDDSIKHETVKDYILTGKIERTYTSPSGLQITLQAPSQLQLMQAIRAIDQEVYESDQNISMDHMSLIRNNNILAIYTKAYGKKDYLADQGDKYYSEDGFMERKKELLDNAAINVFVMDWAIKRLNEFQQEITDSFEAENLKNS